MAEGQPGVHPTSQPATAPKTKQYVRASSNDEALEPDALRGTNLIKELGIEDEDEERRKKMEGKS